MDEARWREPRSALIIAADRFDDTSFARLRSPSRDAQELAKVLDDPSIGRYRTTVLLNKPAQAVRETIESFFADSPPQATLLLYISCHGIKNERGQLRFATTDTKLGRLESTGITAEFIADQMDRSRSRRIAVLLDCCYSGAFPASLLARSGDEVSLDPLWDAAPQGRGRVVITSSRATEYAFETRQDGRVTERLLAKAEPSVFTDAVVTGLRSGEADSNHDGWVTPEELYEYVHEHVPERAPGQAPQFHGRREGNFAVARNPAAVREPSAATEPAPRMRRHLKIIIPGAAVLLAAAIAVTILVLLGNRAPAGTQLAIKVDTCAGVSRVASSPRLLGTLAVGRAGATARNDNDWVGAAFAPDCHLMAAAGNGAERIIDLAEGHQLLTMPANLGKWVFAAAFTPDGQTLIVPTNDGVTELWSVSSGLQLTSLASDPNGNTFALALARDGRTLVTGGTDNEVGFWDVVTGTRIRNVPVNGIGCIAMSPDGNMVAVGSYSDGVELLLDVHSGKRIATLPGPPSHAYSMTFSPDSRTLVVATGAGLQWWDVARDQLIGQSSIPADDVAFRPDGKILAAGGPDRVTLLNASTRQPIAPPLQLGSAGVWVTGMAFSRFGGVLAVGWNGTLQFWNVAGVSPSAHA